MFNRKPRATEPSPDPRAIAKALADAEAWLNHFHNYAGMGYNAREASLLAFAECAADGRDV